jgi:chromate transporter
LAATSSAIVLTRGAVVDVKTALVTATALVLLWRFKVKEPVIVLLAGLAGLLLH